MVDIVHELAERRIVGVIDQFFDRRLILGTESRVLSSADNCLETVSIGCRAKDQPSVKELIDDADDSMFSQLMNTVNHVLHQLIAPDVTLATTCDFDTMIVYLHTNLIAQ